MRFLCATMVPGLWDGVKNNDVAIRRFMDNMQNDPSALRTPAASVHRPRWILNTLAVLFLLVTVAVSLYPSFIDAPDLAALERKVRQDNPGWNGNLVFGRDSAETSLFDFGGKAYANSVSLSGAGLRDLSALRKMPFQSMRLFGMDGVSLDLLRGLRWMSQVSLSIRDSRNMKSFAALESLPVAEVEVMDCPGFTDTLLLGGNLRSVHLVRTGVTRLDFRNPDLLEALTFSTDSRFADISQIPRMTRLSYLNLDGQFSLDGVDLTPLAYLASFALEHSEVETVPALTPDILSSICLSDCPNLKNLDFLNGKMVDMLYLKGCGDPEKLFSRLANVRINTLVVREAHVTDLAFLRRIKGLSKVHFLNCTGLPERINEPFVDVFVENI